ncbi:Anaphase-promoting complex subunit CDC16 [Nakaseomyces glabratus]|nr:Anaphase-promoting complex subunit CDC16 [Nakaseomyces glabratus]KTB25393.1 Anaphase-promoting complex subunit CDC16 [Nakaseomyces glabratus]
MRDQGQEGFTPVQRRVVSPVGAARSPLLTSPLVQKYAGASLATPRRHLGASNSNNGNNGSLLASMSKNSMLGSTIPSTLRKVSLQREFHDNDSDVVGAGVGGGPRWSKSAQGDGDVIIVGAAGGDNTASPTGDGEGLNTTTLTTTTTTVTSGAGNGSNEIDIAKIPLIERLQLWRHDAWIQHLYGTAEFVATKIYTMTGDANDAFWLALIYYSMGSHNRCIELLTKDDIISVSIVCRYLLARCYIDVKNYDDALDIVGETNPFADTAEASARIESDGGIKLESSMCFLRGKIYVAQNDFSRAKEAFKEAVLVDPKNFEAYRQLVDSHLLTTNEEWELLESLDFDSLGDDSILVKSLYTLELSKNQNQDRITEAQDILRQDYDLADDIDIVTSDIDILFNQCKFSQCLNVCELMLKRDQFNNKILPTYISCLYEAKSSNKLFLLAHELAEKDPRNCITWYCVATYYMLLDRIPEARKYFSKSSIMDPTFVPAWLGFAHTFALEGEQDQAISAYSTAARFFPGMSLPNLFLGMQYMASNTLTLAEEYFSLAYESSPQDPVILNEIGVLKFKKGELHKAKRYLKKAAECCKDMEQSSKTVLSVQINLSHTYRRLGENEKAIKYLTNILEDTENSSEIYCSLGFLYLKTNQLQKAIDALHRVLAINPGNSSAQKLLNYALELNVTLELDENHPLVVNSNILDEEHSASKIGKRRQPFESINVDKKRNKAGQLTEQSLSPAGEAMDIE